MDLQELVGPAHTALCIVECQNGVVGPESSMAAVADAVAKAGLLSRLGGLAAAARTAGVKVVHATFHSRADQWGGNRNSRLFAAARRSDVQQVVGTPAVDPTPELGYEPGVDVVLPRFHGLSADSGSGLSAIVATPWRLLRQYLLVDVDEEAKNNDSSSDGRLDDGSSAKNV